MSYNVNVYSLASEGNHALTNYFKVREFRCKDGSDVVFISPELVDVLQDIRIHFNKPVTINSAYRTVSHNKTVGGSSKESNHCKGLASDIVVKGVSPDKVYEYLDKKYSNKYGIGKYKTFTHIDIREVKARWRQS